MKKFFNSFWGKHVVIVIVVVVAMMVYKILEKKGITTQIEEVF